ncbi:hypothetical protein T03_1645 [Trichinella britovi]|uniref:Uncharacterized protein n=1 Tax=Trichinella britovi TaxID=45882 RepID=A0A0V1CJJ3_TRIBR|nr:hypothetical protein T03_1645 [Trichinella britovi]
MKNKDGNILNVRNIEQQAQKCNQKCINNYLCHATERRDTSAKSGRDEMINRLEFIYLEL